MQPLFLQGPSVTLRTILLVIVSIVMMMADHRWGHLESARGVIESYIIYPLRYTINLPSTLLDWTDESLSSHQLLLQENKKLREQQLRAQVSLQKLGVLEKENDRLRKMLSAQPKVGEQVLVAEILSLDIDPYKQLVMLNKGQSSDVYIGQPIIDAWGVMGQVVHLAQESSSALLISDPSHAIPVQVNRSGLRSIAFGTGRSLLLELRYIPHNADLEVGDEIITSGLGGRFPPSYPVGRVVSVERPAGESFAKVLAEPVAHLARSREVLLVWHNAPIKEAVESTDTHVDTGGEGKMVSDVAKPTPKQDENRPSDTDPVDVKPAEGDASAAH
ncbi:Rod shape-determining protein MreC [hydrothermal vent metagenome]|uniref:Cell shape-determining protein MreC n=1 Tax=hydrothermal vent metagenome TaxID=652676 RepID=A0A3B0XLJ2_9ZZZZ